MALCPLDSALCGGQFGDPEIGALFSDTAEIAAMIRVEAALALAQARCGVIPAQAAAAIEEAIDAALRRFAVEESPDGGGLPQALTPAALGPATAAAGVAAPALVAALRGLLPPEAAHWLHWGATSQDIADTALILRLRAALDLIAGRLDALIATLADLAEAHAGALMAGRTRSQIAAPITFGLRAGQWIQPLADARESLAALRPRLLKVQFGGAVGANAAVAPHGPAIMAALAMDLDLAPCPPWHTARGPLNDCAHWCAGLCGALAKMAGDLMLMGRAEIAEAQAGAGGGSSTMPQKSNPVAAETVLALARYAAALSAAQNASVHAEERDGAAWSLEWLTLPQTVVAAGACLRHAQDLADTLTIDATAMRANLDLGGGGAMAEAASFALAAQMPRAEAQALLKAAVREAATGGETLAAVLIRRAPPGVDWAAALDPAQAADAVRATLTAILTRAQRGDG